MSSFSCVPTPSFQILCTFAIWSSQFLLATHPYHWYGCSEVIFLGNDSWMPPRGRSLVIVTPAFLFPKWFTTHYFNLDSIKDFTHIMGSRTVRMNSSQKETQTFRVLEGSVLSLSQVAQFIPLQRFWIPNHDLNG